MHTQIRTRTRNVLSLILYYDIERFVYIHVAYLIICMLAIRSGANPCEKLQCSEFACGKCQFRKRIKPSCWYVRLHIWMNSSSWLCINCKLYFKYCDNSVWWSDWIGNVPYNERILLERVRIKVFIKWIIKIVCTHSNDDIPPLRDM